MLAAVASLPQNGEFLDGTKEAWGLHVDFGFLCLGFRWICFLRSSFQKSKKARNSMKYSLCTSTSTH